MALMFFSVDLNLIAGNAKIASGRIGQERQV